MAFGELPRSVDLNRPNAARSHDFSLGGAHNFAVDREFAEQQRAFLGDHDLVDAGLTWTKLWRPDGNDPELARLEDATMYAALVRVHPTPS